MQKMGYIFGTGLGQRSEGRVEPVPVVVYPSGKSLDWIADHRDECEAATARKQKIPEAGIRKAPSTSMFDLLNVACSSRSLSSASTRPKSSTSSKTSSTSNSSPLNVKSLNQDLAIAKMRQEVARLKESASRHKTHDPATFKSIQARLEMTQSKLQSMEKESSSIDKDKILARERKRLTTF